MRQEDEEFEFMENLDYTADPVSQDNEEAFKTEMSRNERKPSSCLLGTVLRSHIPPQLYQKLLPLSCVRWHLARPAR